MKGGRIVCVTAYDAPSASMADEAGVDLILVGDSVGNVVLGYEDTLPVTMEQMLHHVAAARRGCKRALLVADMPFGSFQVGTDEAVANGIALVKAGADAVKLEGPWEDAIRRLVQAGVPVLGHVGMTPQSHHVFGGFKVQGRGEAGESVLDAAKRIERSGAFAVVLELVPAELAKKITAALTIPTIGIGAGPHCDGEVQVFHDLLGLLPGEPFRHTRRFLDGRTKMVEALKAYASAVRDGSFPTDENAF
ncbi:MAG: 3-methyl-2-oxobutanoate hydroxymethyltransferase [Armatimonadetes bacterium]|nr:MAG: 3-methyl-2-oxobutanoate hydroxymethyltransferase [Armatimonadota bacterium]